MGKTNALLSKEEHKVATTKFINHFATISKSPELAVICRLFRTIKKKSTPFTKSQSCFKVPSMWLEELRTTRRRSKRVARLF